LNPVPIGVPGELYIGGHGLARGYLNRSQLTAEHFINHTFTDNPHARLYKTGDLARYLPDGNIEFLGRVDSQVKIRGFRIEPGEIEVLLSQYPGVQDAVVVMREDVPDDKRLVAYLVQDTKQSIAVDDIQHFLKDKLPQYMMPSAFIPLASLPLTPNGKIDRKALPAPDSVKRTIEEAFVTPTSLVQYQITQIWEELLNVRPIGIRDNFFYLGGHSLLAVRLVDRIEQVCGKRVPLATLLTEPTIENLANALQAEAKENLGSPGPLIAIQASGTRHPFFYLHGTWNNEAFYCFHLVHHLGPDQPFYALEPYHFDHKQAIAPTVEAMAVANIQLLRSIQPEGPYYLGGFCNGGLVAYEMARQLSAEGQKVNLLVLIDPAYSPIVHKIVRGLISGIGKLLRLSQEKQLECFLRMRHIYKYLLGQRRSEDLHAFRGVDPSIHTLTPTIEALRQDDHGMYDWIIGGYNYAPYPGKVALLWARQAQFGKVWKRKAAQEKNIELRFIPGTHMGCLTDHIQSLAEELAISLSQAQATELK
jgi:acyl carrier protein